MNSEELQKEHFNKIFSQYETHYDDACSQKYRLKFMYNPLFEEIAFSGSKVLEAMCGSGQATQYLLSKGAIVTGLDISEAAITSFKERWPNCNAECTSVFNSKLKSNFFDCVVAIAALHHLHPNVNKAIDEIHRVLKVGGYFCFIEPHSNSLPDLVRKFWYKHDRKFFAENEASIDIDRLKDNYSSRFKFVKEKYAGNIAYFLVLSSLILRIPLRFKPIYTTFLLQLESFIEKFQRKLFSCFAVCVWQKKE